MTLPTKKFDGSNFFRSIRTDMDSNKGMVVGNDNGLQFVVLDAAFYRLEIFLRDDNASFTKTALSLSNDICVVTNGSHTNSYNYLSAKRADWEGEVITHGSIPRAGVPPSFPGHYFIGRENGIPIWRYHSGRGDPSKFSPKLEFALGRLLPLIQNRVRAVPLPKPGEKLISGTIPSNAMTQWEKLSPTKGKIGAGIHRASGCLFVFCQEDKASPGMHIRTLIDRMMVMGVNDAVLGDGSDSACIIVNRAIHATPASKKNRSITTGFMFRLSPIHFYGGSIDITSSTDSHFPYLKLKSVVGYIEATTTGLDLILYSFGQIPNSNPSDTAVEIEIN